MKYRKPADLALHRVEAFLNSLPDEFEILGPGEVAVKWPKELTRDEMEHIASNGTWNKCTDALFNLAAIAPERKKRKVVLWMHETYGERDAPMVMDAGNDPGSAWRKVGECEIEE